MTHACSSDVTFDTRARNISIDHCPLPYVLDLQLGTKTRNEKSKNTSNSSTTTTRKSQVLRDGDGYWWSSAVTASLQQTHRRPAQSSPIYHVRVLLRRKSSPSERRRLTIVPDRVVNPLAAMTPRPPRLCANPRP